jgi:hypothetical protein
MQYYYCRGCLIFLEFYAPNDTCSQSQWSRGLRHELFSLARMLGSWIRIPLKAWMSVLWSHRGGFVPIFKHDGRFHSKQLIKFCASQKAELPNAIKKLFYSKQSLFTYSMPTLSFERVILYLCSMSI